MLGKVMKYDFKWVCKPLLVFYILGLIFSVATRLMGNIQNSIVFTVITQICSGAAISMMASIVINSLMRCWVRFIRNIYKDESYLTHTLPVKNETIFLSKVLTGGFGKNKLNPALAGSFFITVIFSSLVGGYLNPYEVDTISSATPLSNMTAGSYVLTYDKLVAPFGSLLNFFFGNIPGAIGETSSLLCIVSFIYLTYKKMIKWRIPVSYVLTVVLISSVICITKDIGLWFILFNILSGGLLFGAVFMATDPVTTPITNTGQLISGVFLGIITMFIRYLTPLPEGVLISILIVNLMTILINYLSIKLYNKKIIKILLMFLSTIIALVLGVIISTKVLNKEPDDSFSILSKTKSGNIIMKQGKFRCKIQLFLYLLVKIV